MHKHILIVNDHLPMAPLPASLPGGMQLTRARTGKEGLQALGQPHAWAVLLAAVQLPDMSGFDFFREAAKLCQATPMLLTPDQALPDALHQANQASIFRVVPTSTPAATLEAILADGADHCRLVEQELHLREQVAQLTTTDPLTGCANRMYGVQQLDRELSRSQRYGHALSIILSDLDGLRNINEGYGQQIGDRVLAHFGRIALNQTRHEIDTVVRWGEDEFLIILPETPIRGAGRAANRLRAQFDGHRTVVDGQQIDSSASFGVTAFTPEVPDRNFKVEELLLIAGRCLLQAKATGGNQVLCCP